MVLKIAKKKESYIAKTDCPTPTEGSRVIGPCSENELKQRLQELGFDQRDIEQAFVNSDTTCFSVGKW